MAIIDIHAHILPRSLAEAHNEGRDWFGTKVERTAEGRTQLTTGTRKNQMSTPEYWLDYPERIPLMDAAGIDVQVISLNPQLLRDSEPLEIAIAATRAVNDEIAEAVGKHNGRFAGLATVPLQDPHAGVAELERAIRDLGLKGLIIGSHVDGHNWDDPNLFPILEAAADLGAFILLHPLSTRSGHIMPAFHMTNLIGNPMETTIAAGALIFSGVIDRLPKLKLCLSHAGGYLPYAAGRFDHGHSERAQLRQNCPRLPSDYLRSFYYDIITHSGSGLQQVANIVGTDCLLLGTDFPADMAVKEPVTFLKNQEWLSSEARANISGNTAAKLLDM